MSIGSRKRRKPSTTHTTISVPKELRKRMDQFQKRNLVNWSHIAVEAWQQHMDQKENPNEENRNPTLE